MTATDHALELVHAAARAASDKLASNIIAFDVSEQLAITDAFLLASATNDRQVKAIVDEVEDKLREIGAKPIRREGERDGRWVLIDYGEIVVHVQHEEERAFYALERLWRDCPVDRAARPTWRRRPVTRRTAAHAAARPAPPRPDRLERRAAAPRATPTSPLDDTGPRPGRRGGAVARRDTAPVALWTTDLARARETAERTSPRPTGLTPSHDPRLREYDVGERTGLTVDEFAERSPRSTRLPARPLRRGPRRRDDAEQVAGRGWCRRCASCWRRSAPGETGVVVVARRRAQGRRCRRCCGWPGRARRDTRGDGQLRLGRARRDRAPAAAAAARLQPASCPVGDPRFRIAPERVG